MFKNIIVLPGDENEVILIVFLSNFNLSLAQLKVSISIEYIIKLYAVNAILARVSLVTSYNSSTSNRKLHYIISSHVRSV